MEFDSGDWSMYVSESDSQPQPGPVSLPLASTPEIYPDGKPPFAAWKLCSASPMLFRLLAHCARRAELRAACSAGINRAIKRPIIVIATNSSTSVNAGCLIAEIFLGRWA